MNWIEYRRLAEDLDAELPEVLPRDVLELLKERDALYLIIGEAADCIEGLGDHPILPKLRQLESLK